MDTDWGAIAVEGLIAGTVVMLGVVVAARLDRNLSRDRADEERALTRRRAVEVAFQELEIVLTSTVAGLTDPDSDRSERSAWWQGYMQSIARLHEIQLQARDFDGADEVARVAKELYAALAVATMAVPHGGRLSPVALLEELSILPLRDAIFGAGEVWEGGRFKALKERIESYVQE